MLSSSAVRALLALALSVVAWAAPAMPLDPAERPLLLMQEHWPQARWADAPSFIVTALPGLNEAASLDPPWMPSSSLLRDPAEQAGNFMATLTRQLATSAEQPSLLGIDLSMTLGSVDSSARTSGAYAAQTGVMHAAATAVAVQGTAFAAVAPAWQRGAAYQATPPQQASMGLEAEPLRRVQLLPWIGFALGLLALGWIGWRAAG
jgi:hypothetical protein